ncbi:MAG: DUF3991 domain-containing protein [Verrucomicrobiae bacterium]|nr:DUF3991 domain-containing protein [Verrucomicrobiae bacterium]
MDLELETFKTDVNLPELAAARGYALDRRASSRNSVVMRHADGDKIIIARYEGTTHWVYFSIRNDRDNGTVVDFLQNRGVGSLGMVRKTLRDWLGSSRPVSQLPLFVQELQPVSRDRAGVIAEWEKAAPCAALPYLTGRGLGPDVLGLPLFTGRIRVDRRNNALFPHYDKEGLCGFEVKNKGFTGFASGGVKGLWYSEAKTTDGRLVLVESAIDAMSFHVLFGDQHTRYMSTGGELNPQQPTLLRGAMEKLHPSAEIILAFDDDEGGEKITKEIEAAAPAGRKMVRMRPEGGKDWNQILKNQLGLE